MKENPVANQTALELYRQAYHLHYDKGNLEQACRVYRQIATEYPHSREAAYAFLQLEKIAAPSFARERAPKVPPLLTGLLLAVLIVLVAGLTGVGVWQWRELKRTTDALEEGVTALAILAGGDRETARERMLELLKRDPSNPLAAAVVVELLLSESRFDQATRVYAAFRAAGGDSARANRETQRIDFRKRQAALKGATTQSPQR